MAATAESVLKPDFQSAAQALHLHRRARTAARVDHELRDQRARAARGRVGGDDVPGLGLPRAWASWASSAWTSPRSTAGRAATTSRRWCSAEAIAHANCGGLAMGVAVQTDMAMPPILAFGTEEQKQQWVVPAIKGEKILCLGHHRARRRLGRRGHQDARRARRRRIRDQRLEDVHHQRPPRAT